MPKYSMAALSTVTRSCFLKPPARLTLPTPGRLSMRRMILSASLYSSSGEAAPETEMMRMGWLFKSNLAITGFVASLGSLSAMPASAFCTSMTAAFMSVDIVNIRIV